MEEECGEERKVERNVWNSKYMVPMAEKSILWRDKKALPPDPITWEPHLIKVPLSSSCHPTPPSNQTCHPGTLQIQLPWTLLHVGRDILTLIQSAEGKQNKCRLYELEQLQDGLILYNCKAPSHPHSQLPTMWWAPSSLNLHGLASSFSQEGSICTSGTPASTVQSHLHLKV